MRPPFGLHNPLDGSDDGFWYSAPDFSVPGGHASRPVAAAPAAQAPPPTPVVLPDETAQAQAAVSGSGSGGVGSVVAETSGGLTINLIFDAAAMAAPASFRTGIQQAAALLSATISDKITLNFNIDYSGTGGGAAAGPDGGQWVSYATVKSDLVNNASTGDTTFNALPAGSTVQGQSSVAVWNAQLKLWGLLGAADTTSDDGSATFATDINPTLLVGVALHELTHAMGRVPYGPQPDIFDLFRYTSAGARLFSNSIPASAAYFSVDGGSTKLANYGQNSDPSDFLNNGVQGANDPFNEYYTGSTLQHLTTVDLAQLDALGFHLASSTPTIIEAIGSTSLVQFGDNYFFNLVAGGTGPELKLGGNLVKASQLGSWAPIGAEATASGYEVAFHVAGADQYTVWNTDSSGNFVSDSLGVVSGSNAGLEALETSFHQDLNGDGVIGISGTTIEAIGSTSLVQFGANYFFDPVAGGAGPELKLGGNLVIASQLGSWAPIGVEAIAGGYEVAFHVAGADRYTVWTTDSSGNYVSDSLGVVSGSNAGLEALETSFHQDLNGDGVIGIGGTTIEAIGSTSLVQFGANYFFNPVAGGAGPELTLGGNPVIASQLGSWAPIGVEATASGYELAWHATGADRYTVWTTDSSGNFVSDTLGVVSGSNASFEALETSFHQDLNGDGVIGIGGTIEAIGSTRLVQFGDNYFFEPVAGGAGPELTLGGNPVYASQLGNWAPIGVEATASGYELAFHVAGADRYTVWNTDSSGNFLSDSLGVVSGSNAGLEALETSFHQDLNGDGVIGLLTTPGSTSSQTAAVSSGQTTFDGVTLTLQQPATFTGQIIGFTGDGTQGSDQIDLRGLTYNAVHSSFDTPSGTLSVSDGATAASLRFLGQYSQDNFHFADDGSGGTLVVAAAPPGLSGNQNQVANVAAHDTFVFAPNFGQFDLANFVPATDTLQFSKSVFADVAALAAATHDDVSGNAVITDAAHDTITLQHVTTAQLLAHQSDFHIV